MNKPLLSLVLLFVAITGVIAQPSLTQAYAYVPGDVTVGYMADTVGVQPGANGANVTWNFSTLQLQSSPTSANWITPASTGTGSSYPTATVANTGSAGTSYFKVSSTSTELVGQKTSGGVIQAYSNSHIWFTYPFTYNSSITDNFAATYNSGGFNTYRNGTSYTTGDGYGTLILPSGTYTNVLKVHLHYTQVDSIAGFGSGGTYAFNNLYLWYDASHKDPILTIGHVGTVTGGTTYGVKVVSVSSFAVGMDEISSIGHVALYPNPVISGNCSVAFELKNNSKVDWEITNLSGQKVLEGTFGEKAQGEQTEMIDAAGLSSGLYFITLTACDGRTQKKLIIE